MIQYYGSTPELAWIRRCLVLNGHYDEDLKKSGDVEIAAHTFGRCGHHEMKIKYGLKEPSLSNSKIGR